ncbi:phage protease [Candidatus Williamhamiltonella defendens]|uniref:phage protease n=1 Tax=Candidatus Williamhamiltonella defendens TaxID=138072 RepID=UPI001930E4F2|nr:phage protease [Candidatus Hamiltonella defensa]
MVDAFQANQADLPIDIEHATELKAPRGDPAPAVGWIKGLEVRDGGAVWGWVEWNPQGRSLMEEKSYRYLSPVFTFDTKTKRILQLYSAGLTNQPNLHLTALNQRIQPAGEHVMTLPLALCTALGLSAQEAQAVSAIHQMKTDKDKALNSVSHPSLEKFVPRADHDAALNRAQAAEIRLREIEHKTLHQHIEDELEKALKTGAITPATVAYHRACCQQDGGLKRFREFLQCAPRMGEDTDWDKKAVNKQNRGLSEEDKVACSSLGLDKDAFNQIKETASWLS